MSRVAFAVFDTALGTSGIAWTSRGVVRVLWPEPQESRVKARLYRTFPDSDEALPPRNVAAVIETLIEMLRGELVSFDGVPLDREGLSDFDRKVYELACAIPSGEMRTYGALAEQLGDRTLARAVGQALGRNPFPLIVPCHRVLAADGTLGGFSAPGGVESKQRILAMESAHASSRFTLQG